MIAPYLLLLIGQGAPSAAADASLRLAILPAIVAGPYGKATVQEMYEAVSAGAAMRIGLRVATYNQIFVDGAEIANQVKACGSDRNCTSAALRHSQLDLGLEVIANFALDPPLVTISLIDSAKATILGEAVVELATGEPLGERLDKEAQVLLKSAGHPRGGEVVIRATPSDSTIVFAGGVTPDRARRDHYLVLPGPQRLEVIHAGFVTDVRQVEVRAGESQTVDVTLVAIEPEGGFVGSPLFWGALGVVAIGTAATVAVIATSGPGSPSCLCIATATSPCGTCQ